MNIFNASIFLLLITSFGLQGCWSSKTKLISDDDAEIPENASYMLASSTEENSVFGNIMLELTPGPGNRYRIINLENIKSDDKPIYFQFQNVGGILGPDKYVIQISDDSGTNYQYLYATEISNGWNITFLKFDENNSPVSPPTLSGLNDRSARDAKKGATKITAYRVEKMTMAAAKKHINYIIARHNEELAKQAAKEQAARDKAEVEELRRRSIEVMSKIELAVAQQGVEPTESEMSQAIRRSTAAGAFLNVSVRKLGNCRKAAEADYYCRYDYLGVNWGNFWKQNGTWYFKIVND